MNLGVDMGLMFCTVQGKTIDMEMECLFYGRKSFASAIKNMFSGEMEI